MSRVNVPESIDPSGSEDVTAELTDFVNSQPDGTDISFPPSSRYRCESILQLINRKNMRIFGNRSVIFAMTDGSTATPPTDSSHLWPRKRTHVKLLGGENILIDSLHVVGAHPSPGENGDYLSTHEAQHGFELLNVLGAHLVDCRVRNVYGDFVYMAGPGGVWCEDIILDRFDGRSNGRQGVAITAARRVSVLNSYFDDVRRTFIDIEPNGASGGAEDVTISQNCFGRQRLNWISGGGHGPNVKNLVVQGNRLLNSVARVDIGNSTDRRGPVAFEYNVCHRPYGSPSGVCWSFWNIDGVRCTHNYQKLQAGRSMYLVGVSNCTDHGTVNSNILPDGIGDKKIVA
jgi:hypothetical protein